MDSFCRLFDFYKLFYAGDRYEENSGDRGLKKGEIQNDEFRRTSESKSPAYSE